MTVAENLKAATVSLHFKIEELLDRFRILTKYKMIYEVERREYTATFQQAEQALTLVRRMQEQFDKLNFAPFVNQSKKENLVRKIKH